MTPVNVGTVITRNRLPYARVLAESFLERHPDGTVTTLVLDDFEYTIGSEQFRTVRPEDLGIERDEFFRLAVAYSPLQLACAMKPWVLSHLLNVFGDAVVYLDSDIQVFDSIADVLPLARAHSLVLTPHLTEPPPRPPTSWEEEGRLIGGAYNAGFLAIDTSAAAFLDWWRERLARECVQLPERGYYDDQRWLDLVPPYFDHVLLRDPGYNVAFWNLHTRTVDWTGTGHEVDGVPLRFFHFGGFDPEAPYLISRWQRPNPAVLLSDRPAVAHICRKYAQRLMDAGYAEHISRPYGFETLPNGLRLDGRMREIYHAALLDAERAGKPEPPNPFVAGSEAFIRWLNEPSDRRGAIRHLSRYLLALRANDAELRNSYPNLLGNDADGYLNWAETEGRRTGRIPEELAPCRELRARRDPTVERPVRLQPGVNLVYRGGGGGMLDEIAPELAASLERASIPFVELRWLGERDGDDEVFDGMHPSRAPFNTNIVCLTPIDLVGFAFEVDAEFFARRYSIGVWIDEELPVPDPDQPLRFLDEVWTASAFAAGGLSSRTGKEARVLPLAIGATQAPVLLRSELGLPDGFLVLTLAALGGPFFPAEVEFANPLAAMEAFERAFEPGEGPSLIVRTVGGDQELAALEQLRLATDRPDIVIVDGPLSPAERRQLVAACDCYLSLHRTVEFGIAAAEAMAAGKPVVATEYAGNVEFMNEQTSYLVPARTVVMPAAYRTFWSGSEWGEPDLDEAARLLRRTYEASDEARRVGARASEAMRTRYSLEATGDFLAERLRELATRSPAVGRQAEERQEIPPTAPDLARAWAYLSQGPDNSWGARSRFGAPGRLARRALLRALRPYVARHLELDAALVAALTELTRHQAEIDARLAELSSGRRNDP